MQHTPPRPLMQSQQLDTICGVQISQCNFALGDGVIHQALKQSPHLAYVYSVTGFNDGYYCQHTVYRPFCVNIHVLLPDNTHCFYSLRYESDFSVEAGQQRLLEAEQLNFWRWSKQPSSNFLKALEATTTGAIQ